MLVEPLRANSKLLVNEIEVSGSDRVDDIVKWLDGVDALIMRRTVGEPLMLGSPDLWRRISLTLGETS
jgi:hypothetical protein